MFQVFSSGFIEYRMSVCLLNQIYCLLPAYICHYSENHLPFASISRTHMSQNFIISMKLFSLCSCLPGSLNTFKTQVSKRFWDLNELHAKIHIT